METVGSYQATSDDRIAVSEIQPHPKEEGTTRCSRQIYRAIYLQVVTINGLRMILWYGSQLVVRHPDVSITYQSTLGNRQGARSRSTASILISGFHSCRACLYDPDIQLHWTELRRIAPKISGIRRTGNVAARPASPSQYLPLPSIRPPQLVHSLSRCTFDPVRSISLQRPRVVWIEARHLRDLMRHSRIQGQEAVFVGI